MNCLHFHVKTKEKAFLYLTLNCFHLSALTIAGQGGLFFYKKKSTIIRQQRYSGSLERFKSHKVCVHPSPSRIMCKDVMTCHGQLLRDEEEEEVAGAPRRPSSTPLLRVSSQPGRLLNASLFQTCTKEDVQNVHSS